MKRLLLLSLFGGCFFISPFWIQRCGDNALHPDEECDDGNLTNGDSCSDQCLIEPSCGDGVVEPGEDCDDGNVTNGDGCENDCTISGCGDSAINPTEQCDDGNLINGDGCSSICQLEAICGDSLTDVGEQCDDGNVTSGDGCSSFCQLELCGDAQITPGQRCFFDPNEVATLGGSTRIAVADLDEDGDDDVVLCSLTHVELFTSENGSFAPLASLSLTNLGGCTGLTTGRFGGDAPGFAATHAGALDSSLSVFSRSGASISQRIISLDNELTGELQRIDLDPNDNEDDLVVALRDSNQLRIFSELSSQQDITLSLDTFGSPFDVTTLDANQDNSPDILSSSSQSVASLFFQQSGAFIHNALNIGQTDCIFVEGGDVVGSSLDDAVFACRISRRLLVFEQQLQGLFSSPTESALSLDVPTQFTLADLDRDGDLDIALVDQLAAGQVVLLFNDEGTFTESIFFNVGNTPSSIATGDFNGDSLPDIVVANAGSTFFNVIFSNP